MRIGIFLLLFFLTTSAYPCEVIPKGLNIESVKLTLEYAKDGYSYRYFIFMDFPDLTEACWQKNSLGVYLASLPGKTIKIRGASLDGTTDVLIDEIPTEDLEIRPTSDVRYLRLGHLGAAKRFGTRINIFYSHEINSYFFAVDRLYTVGYTNIIAVDFFTRLK